MVPRFFQKVFDLYREQAAGRVLRGDGHKQKHGGQLGSYDSVQVRGNRGSDKSRGIEVERSRQILYHEGLIF